ncbi:MAG: PAS domain S-box protein [Deltaproteobacteria bacterium]|nr:PAS domain S-box protein [Deltaproteobacteria bacterium]
MKDGEKTKEDLIRELARLRRRVAELETMQKDPDGVNEPCEVSFMPRHITRIEIEEDLRRNQAYLERIVAERTTELERINRKLQQEIVERRKVEDALRKSEERYRRLAENAPDVVYRYEFLPRRRFTFVSPSVIRITGCSPEEYYADADLPFKLVHPDDTVLLECIYRRETFLDGVPPLCLPELRWIREDGTIVWTEEHTAPILDEGGNIIAIETISRNITQRKKAEEALQIAHQKLLGIIEFLPDATLVIDNERRVIAWNKAIEIMTGIPKEDILGRGDHAYAVPFYGDTRPMLIDMVFETDVEFPHEYDFVRKKGNTIYAEAFVPQTYLGEGAYLWIMASPLFNDSGHLIGAIESIRDITEHKVMEQEVRKNAEKIKLFAYSVSHDLKSPIIGINGLTRLLHRQYSPVLNEKGRTYCEQILKASEQASALIEEINEYIKTKEIPVHYEEFKPIEVIQMVRDEFDALLSIRQINWIQPESTPSIKADRMSLLRVLRNLVDNALKYGGPELTEIRIGYEESDEYHIFSVTDDGVGIRDADCERVFGLFQRNVTARGVEGTGLGLAIVKEIAEKHHGKVSAKPGPKKGVTFSCCFSRGL